MSVRKVKVINIIGLLSELDKVIKFCGDSESFHPDDAMSFYSNTQDFIPMSDKNPYSAPLQSLRSAADMAEWKLEFRQPKNFSVSDKGVLKYVASITDRLEALVNQKLIIRQEIDSCRRKIEQVGHFKGGNLDFSEIMKCKYITPCFGRIPHESYEKIEKFAENPFVMFFRCTEDDTHFWGVYFSPNEPSEKQTVDRIFSSLYFEKLDVPDIAGKPEDYIRELESTLSELVEKQTANQKELDDLFKAEGKKCTTYYSRLQELDSYHAIKRYVYKYHGSFILVGWIPENMEEYFTSQLDEIKSIEYSLSDGKEELKHSPPVILKNPPFIRLYEFYVKMYGLPCYNELDPTALVAFTYTLFFGIMFGDVGQGFVVALIGLLMWKFKKMEIGRILVPCGISGMIFGSIYGSVFGFEHALDPVYKALFGLKEKPVEVMQPDTINMIIYGSVAIGIVTIVISMLMNIVSAIKRRDAENAYFEKDCHVG